MQRHHHNISVNSGHTSAAAHKSLETSQLFDRLFTHADESRGSKAFARVCLRVYLCPCDRIKMAETTITKLATGIVHHESWLSNIRSKGHKVQKHISGDRLPGRREFALYRVPTV